MNEMAKLLDANRKYAARRGSGPSSARPGRELAIVTCMDVRIEPLAVFGLALGEAHVLRNAGGRVTEDVLRSLALSVHVLGARRIIVMQHTRCGLAGVTDDELRAATGAAFDFRPIADHTEALEEDLGVLATAEYLQPVAEAFGLLYDVESGAVAEVTSWRRPD